MPSIGRGLVLQEVVDIPQGGKPTKTSRRSASAGESGYSSKLDEQSAIQETFPSGSSSVLP